MISTKPRTHSYSQHVCCFTIFLPLLIAFLLFHSFHNMPGNKHTLLHDSPISRPAPITHLSSYFFIESMNFTFCMYVRLWRKKNRTKKHNYYQDNYNNTQRKKKRNIALLIWIKAKLRECYFLYLENSERKSSKNKMISSKLFLLNSSLSKNLSVCALHCHVSLHTWSIYCWISFFNH